MIQLLNKIIQAGAAVVSTPLSPRAIIERKITEYLNESTKQTQDFDHYKDRTLFQFPVDSLELYELIMELEDLLNIEIDDSVLAPMSHPAKRFLGSEEPLKGVTQQSEIIPRSVWRTPLLVHSLPLVRAR